MGLIGYLLRACSIPSPYLRLIKVPFYGLNAVEFVLIC